MSKSLWNHYFIIVKLTGLLLYMGNTMVLLEGDILQKCLYFFLMTLFLFLTIMTEMTHHPSGLRFLGLGEIIFCILAYSFLLASKNHLSDSYTLSGKARVKLHILLLLLFYLLAPSLMLCFCLNCNFPRRILCL